VIVLFTPLVAPCRKVTVVLSTLPRFSPLSFLLPFLSSEASDLRTGIDSRPANTPGNTLIGECEKANHLAQNQIS